MPNRQSLPPGNPLHSNNIIFEQAPQSQAEAFIGALPISTDDLSAIDESLKLKKDLTVISNQFELYKHISESIQRIKKFNFDINNFIYKKDCSNVKELMIYRIAEYDYLNEKVLLNYVNDQNFSSFSAKEDGFSFLRSLLEKINNNINNSEMKEFIQDNIFEVDINKIENDYYVFLSYEHIFYQLNKEQKFNANIFFDVHQFIEKNFSQNSIIENFSKNPILLTIVIILYYMDVNNYLYNFDNNKFIEKNVPDNNCFGDLL